MEPLAEIFTAAGFAAFLQVVAIDLFLAGDNAVVVGALAAGLPPADRRRVIVIGVAAALVFRIFFALIVTYLLTFERYGLILAGGLLLLWVSWRMWREIRHSAAPDDAGEVSGIRSPRSFASAVGAVALADISMSLDNVLAVAGAARDHPTILVIGLVLSVALMGVASNVIARYIEKYRWLAYIGLAIIVAVSLKMIRDGWLALDPVALQQLLS